MYVYIYTYTYLSLKKTPYVYIYIYYINMYMRTPAVCAVSNCLISLTLFDLKRRHFCSACCS